MEGVQPRNELELTKRDLERLQELGPEKFAAWVRDQKGLMVTDTTMRDAHQSLLATRMRSFDMLAIADAYARMAPGLFSLEMWGGATFDTSMRFLKEDPWDRLARLLGETQARAREAQETAAGAASAARALHSRGRRSHSAPRSRAQTSSV